MKDQKKMQISRNLAKLSKEMLETAKAMGVLTTRADKMRQLELVRQSGRVKDWSREYAEGVV